MLARLHQAVGIGRLFQGKGRVDDRPEVSASEQWPQFLLHASGQPGLLRHRAGAKRRTGNQQPFHHDRPQIGGNLAAVGGGDVHQPSPRGQQFNVLGKVVAADHIEDGVDAVRMRPSGPPPPPNPGSGN